MQTLRLDFLAPALTLCVAFGMTAGCGSKSSNNNHSSGASSGVDSANQSGTLITAPAPDPSQQAAPATTTSAGTPSTPVAAIFGPATTPVATSATSFELTCTNGNHLSGNYPTNSAMCTALSPMLASCPSATTFYQANCSSSSTVAGSGPVTLGTPGTASATTTTSSSTTSTGNAISFNLNCSNGSNYNGSYSTHANMCANLQTKIAACPTQATPLYSQLCP